MVFAWKSATGALPTYSKSKSRPLPFQRLLKTINRELIEPDEIRHQTDFQHPAVLPPLTGPVNATRARTPVREWGESRPNSEIAFAPSSSATMFAHNDGETNA